MEISLKPSFFFSFLLRISRLLNISFVTTAKESNTLEDQKDFTKGINYSLDECGGLLKTYSLLQLSETCFKLVTRFKDILFESYFKVSII